jgi:hypothetical protein
MGSVGDNFGGNFWKFPEIWAQKAYIRTRLADFWPRKAYERKRKLPIFALKKLNFRTILGRSFSGPRSASLRVWLGHGLAMPIWASWPLNAVSGLKNQWRLNLAHPGFERG